jgi:hypothetical protein
MLLACLPIFFFLSEVAIVDISPLIIVTFPSLSVFVISWLVLHLLTPKENDAEGGGKVGT